MRVGRPRDFARGEFSSEAMVAPDSARAFLSLPAVQREMRGVVDEPFPEVGQLQCAPFPKNTPPPALDLGRPITSAVLVQEYLIGLVFLRVCGWLFMAVGGLMFLWSSAAAVSTFAIPNAARMPDNAMLGIAVSWFLGLGVGGAGAWFGIFRGRVVTQMCWFCPRGMVWRTDSVFEWYGWEEVPEVYCMMHAPRPAIGLRFTGDISWISFSSTNTSRLMVPYLENRASAAWIRPTLQSIAEGRTIRFGDWHLRKSAVGEGSSEFDWRDVIDIKRSNRELTIHHRDGKEMIVFLDEVPFPSMFLAIARALHGR